MQALTAWVKKLALLAVLYLVFAYVGQFTSTQSAILAILAVLVIELVQQQNNPLPGFEPFFVRISPNWDFILQDYKLADPKHFEDVCRKLRTTKGGSQQYHVLTHGISFTVLSPKLFYSDNHNCFLSKIDFREDLKELNIGSSLISPPSAVYAKVHYVTKARGLVLEIGVITEESWKKSYMPRDGRELIPVASLPMAEFAEYYSRNLNAAASRQREEQLKAYGWTHEKREIEDRLLDFPFSLTHKYFTVAYKAV